jgi:DNA-binding NtrC family response regulator
VGSRAHILIIEQNVTTLEALRVGLASNGFLVEAHADPAEAFRALDTGRYDVIVTGASVPHVEGIGVLDRVQRRDASVPVIVLAARSAAGDAVKRGAFDTVEAPVRVGKVRAVIERALEVRCLREEVARLRAELNNAGRAGELIAHSPAMARVVELADSAATTDADLLITGAPGTGKQLVARSIHAMSRRAGTPFVVADGALLARAQIESALFGHVRGAFPGAAVDHHGAFEAADGGTLFLNAVDELSKPAQLRLVRVLDERAVRPLGSTGPRPVDVRFVAASTVDLAAAVNGQRVRRDLYERLSTVHIALPLLRERRDDIPLLAHHFVKRTCARLGSDGVTISPEAMQCLLDRPWPGNVDELRDTMERAVLTADSTQIRPEHLAEPQRTSRRQTLEAHACQESPDPSPAG